MLSTRLSRLHTPGGGSPDQGCQVSNLLLARERCDGVDLAWRGDLVIVDGDVPARLRVNDEDAAAADDDYVHLGGAAARPAAVGEKVLADAGARGEDLSSLALGAVGDLVVTCLLPGGQGVAEVFGFQASLPARFGAC